MCFKIETTIQLLGPYIPLPKERRGGGGGGWGRQRHLGN